MQQAQKLNLSRPGARKPFVLVIQPVIPLYRQPLFEALAARAEFDIAVHSSQQVQGGPPSIADVPMWGDTSHECLTLLGGRFYWQRGLRLPSAFGVGDVLVLNGNPRFLSSLSLAIRARRRGAAIIWWGHWWSATSVRWRAAIRFKFMSIADVLFLYTEEEARVAAAKWPDRKAVIGLNNTLDTSPVVRAASRWSDERLREFAAEQMLTEKKVLLFCGRLRSDPSTELDVVIRALAILREQDSCDRHLLVIIGAGEQRAALETLANTIGVNDRIRWLGPIYDEEELAPWFMSALCCVLPGSIGLALIHALAYGLPVVTHGERGLHCPEIAALRPGENGLTFPRGDALELSRQLLRFSSEPDLRRRLSEAASQTVRTEFSFDRMVDRFAEGISMAVDASVGRG